MTDWKSWVDYHATLFGMRDQGDVAMLCEWTHLFSEKAYTPKQLHDASKQLATSPNPPRFRTDHLQALWAALHANRRATAGQPTIEPSERVCGLCGGSGRVIVPSLKFWNDRVKLTQAVLCACALGLWYLRLLSGYKDGARLPTLSAYEVYNPDWRDDMHQKHREELAEARSVSVARHQDRLLGKIFERLKSRR